MRNYSRRPTCPSPSSLFKEHGPTIRFRDTGHKNQIWRMQRIFVQCMRVFSTPYSTVLTINVSTQVAQRFIRKKNKIAQHMDPFLWKKNIVDYGIIAQLVANKANVENCPLQREWGGETASYILVSICLICGLRLTRYSLYNMYVTEC